MIDNFNDLSDILKFEKNYFYVIQILKRKKDNPDMNTSEQLKRTYCVYNLEEYNKIKTSVVEWCEKYNARAYILASPRDAEIIAYHCLKLTTDHILNKNFKSVKNVYESVCGSHPAKDNKLWILDIDNPSNLGSVLEFLKVSDVKIIKVVKTVNGFHVIIKPFNPVDYKKKFTEDAEIHKNGMILLYFK